MYPKMEQLSTRSLVNKVRNIRDKAMPLGVELPELPGWEQDVVIDWLLRVQSYFASRALGMSISPADFGAPAALGYTVAGLSQKGEDVDYDLKGFIDHARGSGAAAAMMGAR